MPIYYKEEVTKEVAYGPQSMIIDEAENHIWVQMALIIYLVNPNILESGTFESVLFSYPK